MYFVTLGHFFASSCASADVIRRQLFAPKPSASASVIFLLPHHDGAPATGLPPPLEAGGLLLWPQHPATTSAAAAAMAGRAAPSLAPLLIPLLLRWSFTSGDNGQ